MGGGQASLKTEAVAPEVDLGASTPMMRQYLETKAQHPDAFLFFRLGDFYELFFEDAIRAAEILQITLTARSKGNERVPMCGVPYHAARRYLARLVEAGHKVAICEQVEEPLGPGIVRREVLRVITPAMALDEELLEASENNFLAAVAPKDGDSLGAALLDASTGEFLALAPASEDELVEELRRAEPRELLVPSRLAASAELEGLKAALSRPVPVASVEDGAFDPSRAAAFLKAHFQVASLDGFGLSESGATRAAVGAAGAALRYLKDTQRHPASHVDRISLARREGQLVIDETSRANLEVLRSLRDGSRKGSLLGVVDRTVTAMGARRLSRWLSAPLGQVAAIEARLDAVEELSEKSVYREELSLALRGVADLERLCARLSLAAGNARDLRALGHSLGALPRLCQGISRWEAALLKALLMPLEAPGLAELGEEIDRAVVEEPPVPLKEGGLIKAGYAAELDELLTLSSSSKDFLLKLEARERGRTGIGSLKVRFNKVFGYYLEVTKPNLHLVPNDYVRKQTTVGAERFVTEELKEHEEKVLTAEEKRFELEYRLFEELRAKVAAAAPAIRGAADALATLDALVSFARCAAEYGYARPTVDESEVIEIEAGRHPVVERALKGELFVPNDVRLDQKESQILVITGPNMAGKSTVMRQVALIVLLAQAGSFVPAKRARIGLCDRIFTRVGAADNLARGQSTFMVEMTETANILHHATSKSLVVLDEIGRGTSTFDGLSIAWAVAEHLCDRVGARTLFATHYHELTDLSRERPKVRNCCVAVREQMGRVIFLRKLVPGAASRSYGIEVAKLAGLPKEVVRRAREILSNLESGELDDAGRPRLTHGAARASIDQLGLFASERPARLTTAQEKVIEELRQLSVDVTTPLEALSAVARWKREVSGKAGE
ncbi:MAG: DNA mismatch repair protein MutS [Myxococcales bacterium]|nr:DNA mismatch repair protein MutS [Myxococcales bacterium]